MVIISTMLRSTARHVALVIVALSALCVAAQATGRCEPQFPAKQQWLGGDAAYSIPLPDGRSVWIFGDTLYGDKRVVVGNEPRMVRNSIGISRCDEGKWELDYVMKRGADNGFEDFFKARKKDTWYWALDGFYHDNNLWVTALCLRNAKTELGFDTCGVDLAKVSGLEKDPQQWQVEIQPLIEDGVRAYPSSTAVVEGDFAYIFALYENGSRPLLVTRIPLTGLDNAAKNMQYLAKSGKWRKGFDPKNAKEVMAKGNTEMSIRYHPGLKQWIAVMNYPQMFSDKIISRTAPALTGPWGNEQVIYTMPEMQKSHAAYDADTFCYAGKEHPEFRDDDSILITYACNTRSVPKLATNMEIYFPQVVRIPLSKVKGDAK